jgi:hypothetical protein
MLPRKKIDVQVDLFEKTKHGDAIQWLFFGGGSGPEFFNLFTLCFFKDRIQW